MEIDLIHIKLEENLILLSASIHRYKSVYCMTVTTGGLSQRCLHWSPPEKRSHFLCSPEVE